MNILYLYNFILKVSSNILDKKNAYIYLDVLVIYLKGIRVDISGYHMAKWGYILYTSGYIINMFVMLQHCYY